MKPKLSDKKWRLAHLADRLKGKLSGHEKILAKGTGVAFLGLLALNLMGAISLFAKTHLMVPADLGTLVLAKSLVATVFLLVNGFSAAALRYASVYLGEGDEGKVKGVFWTVYKYAVPFFILLCGLVTVFPGRVLDIYAAINQTLFQKDAGLPTEDLVALIKVLAAMSLFKMIMDINKAFLVSKYLVKYRYLLDVGIEVLMLIFVFVLFLLGWTDFLIAFAWGWFIAAFVAMIFSFYFLRKECPLIFDRSIKPKENKKGVFLFAFISQFTTMLIRYRIETNVLIMGWLLSQSEIALYNVAYQMGVAAGILLQGFNSIFPAMAGQLYGQDKVGEIRRLHFKSAGILGLLGLLSFLLFVLFGKYLLWIFGAFYKQAYIPLLIIAFSFVVESMVGSVGRILNMMGKPHYNTVSTLAALVCMIVVAIKLIPPFGVTGAALAFAISNVVNRLLMLAGVLWLYRQKREPAGS